MAQLQGTDKFIVDRGGSTYKATFEDIEKSLDISHEFTGEVVETEGGEITEFDISNPGSGFIAGRSYEGSSSALFIEFTATKVGDNGELEEIVITSNDPIEGFVNPTDYFAAPITKDGSLKKILSLESTPSIPIDSSVVYKVKQVRPALDDDGNAIIDDDGAPVILTLTGGEVEVINNSGVFEYKITNRGEAYDSTIDAFIIVTITDPSTGGETTSNVSKIGFTTIDRGDVDSNFESATISATEVSDGVDSDKVVLTVTVSGEEKEIYLVPGPGIRFNNLADNEIEVVNTVTEFGQGGGSVSDGASVIVDESLPTVNVYSIKDGTLWYNLSDGRLYVAVSYVANGTTKFDWIDASPSSLNDSIRKNQNDSTNYKIDINNSLYATHYALERLPLIS